MNGYIRNIDYIKLKKEGRKNVNMFSFKADFLSRNICKKSQKNRQTGLFCNNKWRTRERNWLNSVQKTRLKLQKFSKNRYVRQFLRNQNQYQFSHSSLWVLFKNASLNKPRPEQFNASTVKEHYCVYSWSERTSIVSFCKASMASTTETAPDIVV